MSVVKNLARLELEKIFWFSLNHYLAFFIFLKFDGIKKTGFRRQSIKVYQI